MAEQDLGIVGLHLADVYDPEKQYHKMDVVFMPDTGSSYAAKGDTQGNTPPNEVYWQPMANVEKAVVAATAATEAATDAAAVANKAADKANTAAENVQGQIDALSGEIDDKKFFELKEIKDHLSKFNVAGMVEDFEIEYDGTRTWVYATRYVQNIFGGVYTILIPDAKIGESLIIEYDLQSAKILKINEAGTYVFTVDESNSAYAGHLCIRFQVSTKSTPEAGTYYAKNIVIYDGDVSGNIVPNVVTCSADVSELKADVSELKADSGSIKTEYIPTNILNIGEMLQGYMTKGGTISDSTTLYYSAKLPVTQGDILVASHTNDRGNRKSIPFRFVTAFDDNYKVLKDLGYGDSTDAACYSFEVGEGVSYVVLTIHSQYFNELMVEITEDGIISETYHAYVDGKAYKTVKGFTELKADVSELKKKTATVQELSTVVSSVFGAGPISGTADSLIDGEYITLEENCNKKNKSLSFAAEIDSFSTIMLGHGETKYGGSYIVIDNTNIYHYNYTTSASLLGTFAHGLTISDFIRAVISVDNAGNASIVLMSKGGSYSVKVSAWAGNNGTIFAKSVGSTLTDCILNWVGNDFRKSIWAFGDSYFGHTNMARFPYWIIKWGFDNWLLDSYAGQGSTSAKEHLNTALTHGTPKHVVWCLGMNNADSSTAISSTWKSDTESIIAICEEKGVEPILCTIPNVSGGYSDDNPDIPAKLRYHGFKNDYVRESGYRYIDFAKAVGADENGIWYTDMLSSDGVHPTEIGAKALAMQLLMDFPEIMQS